MSVKVTRNVLVPGWIMGVGLVAINAPPQGVAASLSLFLVGVFVIPALVLIVSVAHPRILVMTTGYTRRMRAMYVVLLHFILLPSAARYKIRGIERRSL
jgi:hypothetical protein